MLQLIVLLVVAAVMLVTFLIFRAYVLWYFKLDKIETHLARLVELLEPDEDERECPVCAESIKEDAKVCRHCDADVKKKIVPEQL